MNRKIKTLLLVLLSGTLTACGANLTQEDREKVYYDLAVNAGYQGTYQDWLQTIKGDKGDRGPQGDKGSKGDDGAAFITGEGVPSSNTGKNGDRYLDIKTFDLYVKNNNVWSLECNVVNSSKVNATANGFTTDDLSAPSNINGQADFMLDNKYNHSRYYYNDYHEGMADPQYMYDETYKKVYVYGTCFSSTIPTNVKYTEDLENYVTVAAAEPSTEKTWFGPNAYTDAIKLYATECIKYGGKYYMFYSSYDMASKGKPDNQRTRYNSVMVSDYPDRGFVDAGPIDAQGHGHPVFEGLNKEIGKKYGDNKDTESLDMSPFIDSDGSLYVYVSSSRVGSEAFPVRTQSIWGLKMKDPLTPDYSTLKCLAIPGEISPSNINNPEPVLGWEALVYDRVLEGPFMLKSPVNNKYYLVYTVNHYTMMPYSMCYAVSDSPLGDFVKPYDPNNPIPWSNGFYGFMGDYYGNNRPGGKYNDPVYCNISEAHEKWLGFASSTGHGGVFKMGDEYFICSHAHKGGTPYNYIDRGIGYDHLYFDDEGVPFANGPTKSIQHKPAVLSGYSDLTNSAVMVSKNIYQPHRLTDKYIREHYNLEIEEDRESTVRRGKAYVKFTFPTPKTISSVFVYNSATYETRMINNISYIRFDDGNGFVDVPFSTHNLNKDKEFIFPCSAYTVDIPNNYRAQSVTICFDNPSDVNLNEIKIYGK